MNSSTTGTITNSYGIFIDGSLLDNTKIINDNFGLYQIGSQVNYFQGNLGIGNLEPKAKLDLYKEYNTLDENKLAYFTSFSNINGLVAFRRANGTKNAPSALNDGDITVNQLFQGYNGVDFSTTSYIGSSINGDPNGNILPGRFYIGVTNSSGSFDYLSYLDKSFKINYPTNMVSSYNFDVNGNARIRNISFSNSKALTIESIGFKQSLIEIKNQDGLIGYLGSAQKGGLISANLTDFIDGGSLLLTTSGVSVPKSIYLTTSSSRLDFKVDANGNVGVGTNNPVSKLDVNGVIKVGNDNIISPQNGIIRYNESIGKFQGFAAGSWIDLH